VTVPLGLKRRADAQGKWTDYWAAGSLQSYVTGLYRAAGTNNGTSHSGRRTFATRLLSNGATIEQVQLLLGHQISITLAVTSTFPMPKLVGYFVTLSKRQAI